MSDREAAGSADRVGSRGEQRRGRGGGILRAITRMVTRSQAAATRGATQETNNADRELQQSSDNEFGSEQGDENAQGMCITALETSEK